MASDSGSIPYGAGKDLPRRLLEDVSAKLALECANYLKDRNAARAQRDRLRLLLREWRTTPFFHDEKDWQHWVADFGKRVDAALDEVSP